MTQLEKVKTREALSMYDNLWDQSAIIQQMRAASKQEGEVKASRNNIVSVVRARFPRLVTLAQQKVAQESDIEQLNSLLVQVSTVTDEASVQALLASTAA